MKQEQIHKSDQAQKQTAPETAPVEAKDLKNEKLAEDIEDILDEIDAVLEENAAEFVAGYQQKGGE